MNQRHPYTVNRINSKCVIDLNMKGGTIKLLEDNIGEYINYCGIGNDFSCRMKNANHQDKNDNLEYIKIKKFCLLKNTIKRVNRLGGNTCITYPEYKQT